MKGIFTGIEHFESTNNPIVMTRLVFSEQIQIRKSAAGHPLFMACLDTRSSPQFLVIPAQSAKKGN